MRISKDIIVARRHSARSVQAPLYIIMSLTTHFTFSYTICSLCTLEAILLKINQAPEYATQMRHISQVPSSYNFLKSFIIVGKGLPVALVILCFFPDNIIEKYLHEL